MAFLPPVPKAAIPALLAAMDALYLGWGGTPIYRFGISPNKLMDYMMAGKPVIHAVAAANDPVAESGCGKSLRPRTVAPGPADRATWMHAPEEREAMGQRGKRLLAAASRLRACWHGNSWK